MANRRNRDILNRQLAARSKLWPKLTDAMLWRRENEGWVALPRLMPLMMSIMDDLSDKGFPVSRVYLEMWARLRDEQFLTLNRPEEMAFHAGFEGQRALRTWRDRVQRLANLGFIGLMPGPLGDLSYAVFYNPYHVTKRAYVAGKVQERKWHALVVRANEVSAFDLDDLDDEGNLILDKDENDEEETKPAKKASAAKSTFREPAKTKARSRPGRFRQAK